MSRQSATGTGIGDAYPVSESAWGAVEAIGAASAIGTLCPRRRSRPQLGDWPSNVLLTLNNYQKKGNRSLREHSEAHKVTST